MRQCIAAKGSRASSQCLALGPTGSCHTYMAWCMASAMLQELLSLHGALVATCCGPSGPCKAACFFLQRLPVSCTASCYSEWCGASNFIAAGAARSPQWLFITTYGPRKNQLQDQIALPHTPGLLLQELRAAVFALRAFNIETGLVGEHVHESNLIPVRMQWWRDAVNSMYGERRPVQHPVVSALSQVCPANELAVQPDPLHDRSRLWCNTQQDTPLPGRPTTAACYPRSNPVGV